MQNRADEDRFGHPPLAVASDITRHLTAARRVPYVHGILQIKRGDEFCNIGGVGVHVVPVDRLRGTAMPAAVVGDHPVTLVQKEHHLRIPIVRGKRPAVMKKKRLTFAPILKVDLRAVFHGNRIHLDLLSLSVFVVCGPVPIIGGSAPLR